MFVAISIPPPHRLIRLKRYYRDIMNTMVALAPRLLSIFILILIIYYSFAIIGLEFFSFKVSRGCCNESTYGISLYLLWHCGTA